MSLKQISKNIYEIPKEGKMNVAGRIYASEKIMKDIEKDKTIEQVKNVATLPGIVGFSSALTDAHMGYGMCIGGVAAFDLDKGIVSPGGIGYDINCGVRILSTNIKVSDIKKNQKKIVEALYKKIPSGVGHGSPFQLKKGEMDLVLEKGANFLVGKGYGSRDDLIVEDFGCIENADASKVSPKAKQRGIGQLGTLGAGNHFLEVQEIYEIFDEKTAKVFGLKKGYATIMIHCGSRGLGHQVASDYIKLMEEKYGIKNLPDRELINAPIKSQLGQDYIKAMNCAANFAFANRHLIAYWVKEAMLEIFPKAEIKTLYDICHNIGKVEEHTVEGKKMNVLVHRKGATRSFGPGRKEIPEKYRKIGQPVLIPGSMGTASYILVGTKKAEEMTFGSTAHGAGRVMSRHSAIKGQTGAAVKKKLNAKNIEIKSGSLQSLAEEAPEAYKDVDEVVNIVDSLGLSKKVAKLKPLVVVKG